ncbi:hypothetical protein RJ640_002839 [Escallonia rubra]|uniref:CCHC-type domain-containing protein n=1 Tax=Escallonia rubra TaxID=112253 RepID=A0AA88QR67_9ASTE|nr:hypothetical protein RJ640_002839 [Escallonia rubra]
MFRRITVSAIWLVLDFLDIFGAINHFLLSMASESNQVTQVKLKGSNYSYWSYLLKVFITGKELRGYLDGSVVAPEESDTNYEKLQQEWETNNARILSWINNSVEPSIGMHFSKFTSAKEVWDYLEGLYMQSNFAKRYELENVIRGERQDDKSVQEFYNVMNGIWDQLDLMDPLELRKLAIYQKVREDQKLVQFLMALRTEFEPLRGSMLHRSPLPSVDKVLSELVAEETRLKSSLLHSMQTQAVLVATQRPQFLPLVPSRATPPSGNFRIALDECSFCHEKGHWKRDCPKLRKKGILPSPNHFSQNSRNAQRTMNTGAFMTSVIAPDSSHTSGVTHEDVQSMVTQQIQQLLGTSLNAQPSTSTAMSASPASAHSMNHSGKTSSWIFDSGASHHMTHDSSILVERSTSFIPSSIQTADGSSMEDRHTGRQIGTGRRDGGLYFLQNLFVSPGIAENSALSAFQLNKHSSPFQLWHCRLGHVSGSRLKYMVSNDSSPEIFVPDEVMSSPLPFPSDTPSLPESNADPDDARPSPSQVAPRLKQGYKLQQNLSLFRSQGVQRGETGKGILKMEGRGYSDFYRNTSEELFLKSLMEGSIGVPTMEMLGFKNLSHNFRTDSEELFKSWLTNSSFVYLIVLYLFPFIVVVCLNDVLSTPESRVQPSKHSSSSYKTSVDWLVIKTMVRSCNVVTNKTTQ